MSRQNTQVIAVSSGKGGVGKTTLVVNLGISLSRLGLRVCLLDADTNLANINIMLREAPAYTLHHVLEGEKQLSDIRIDAHGISLIPGASGVTGYTELSAIAQKRLLQTFTEMEQQFDVILVDTSAGIHDSVLSFIEEAHQSIVLITPEPTSLTDSFSLLRMLRKRSHRKRINVVVNQADSEIGARQVFKRFSSAVAKYIGYHPAYLGYVIKDELVSSAVCSQIPVRVYRPNAPASRCYERIGESLQSLLGQFTAEESLSSHLQQVLQDEQPADVLPESQSSPVLESLNRIEQADSPAESVIRASREQQLKYQRDDRARKKQLLEEHKQAIVEHIEDADASKNEISATLNLLMAKYFRRFKEYPFDIVDEINLMLQNQSISQDKINQLHSELMLFYRDHRGRLDRDTEAEMLNRQINDFVSEYGQYPFDTSQALMKSIDMGRVSEDAILQIDKILKLVDTIRPDSKTVKEPAVFVTDIESDRSELVESIHSKVESKSVKLPSSTQALIDSINFASRLSD